MKTIRITDVVRKAKADNRYCGPAVLSALTGIRTKETAAVLRQVSGDRNITGVHFNDLLKALDHYGIKVAETRNYDDLPTNQRPIFKEIIDEERHPDDIYIVASGGHWRVIQGDQYVCGITKFVKPITDKRVNPKSRVHEVIIIKQAVTVADIRNGAEPEKPIYKSDPYVILSDEDVVLWSGTLHELKACKIIASGYYDRCTFNIREHDLQYSDNTKVTDGFDVPRETITELTDYANRLIDESCYEDPQEIKDWLEQYRKDHIVDAVCNEIDFEHLLLTQLTGWHIGQAYVGKGKFREIADNLIFKFFCDTVEINKLIKDFVDSIDPDELPQDEEYRQATAHLFHNNHKPI